MQSRPWLSIVGWLVAFGVPMTPLAGTWIGYGGLALAALITVWQGFSWINQQNWQTEYKKYALLIPSCLLLVIAGVWSFYGGLPAMLPIKTAANLVVKLEPLRLPPFTPDEVIKVNVHVDNAGPEVAYDVQWRAGVRTRLAPINDTLVDETFKSLSDKLSPKVDLGVGHGSWKTLDTQRITDRDATDLKDGRLLLFVVGHITHRDIHGDHHIEFCQFLQPPGDRNVWHLCNLHNLRR